MNIHRITQGVLAIAAIGMAQVTVTDNVQRTGRNCVKVQTPSATYYYDKDGAGFASIVDKDGNDWLSWKAGGGEQGEYRGIPNMGPCCHPGYSGATTTIVSQAADKAVLSSSVSGWRTKWDFFNDHALMTIEAKGSGNYYLLYEGTPGGRIDAGDYFVVPPNDKKSIYTNYDQFHQDISPEWVYFGDGGKHRVLFMVHHENDNIQEQYWQMGGDAGMTVWGFGRTCVGACQGMSAVPGRLSIGIMETEDNTAIVAKINGLLNPTKAGQQTVSAQAAGRGVMIEKQGRGTLSLVSPDRKRFDVAILDVEGTVLATAASDAQGRCILLCQQTAVRLVKVTTGNSTVTHILLTH